MGLCPERGAEQKSQMDELKCTDKMLMARADLEPGAYSTTHAWKRRSNPPSYVELAQYIRDFLFSVFEPADLTGGQSVWKLLSFQILSYSPSLVERYPQTDPKYEKQIR